MLAAAVELGLDVVSQLGTLTLGSGVGERNVRSAGTCVRNTKVQRGSLALRPRRDQQTRL